MFNQIIKNLFIGDKYSAFSPENLNFDSIINVTSEIPKSKCLTKNICFYRFRILDLETDINLQKKMFYVITKAVKIIHSNLELNKKVLVHCAKGQCRSVTLVAAYLIMYKNMAFDYVIVFLQTKHKPSFDFGTKILFKSVLIYITNVLYLKKLFL